MARLTIDPNVLGDTLPDDVDRDLRGLADALDGAVPPKIVDRNLLLATWNIRRLGSLTPRWHAAPDDTPKRDWTAAATLAEVIARFDVVAVQEVCGNLRALETILALLGRDWGYLMTDVNAGDAGNGERMAFVYDRRRVRLSGLAAELVVPTDTWRSIVPGGHRDQFARAPYAVSFAVRGVRFVLVTLHINYGTNPRAERLDELRATAEWLSAWSSRGHGQGDNVILLGDFNIDRHGDPLWNAFTSTGLTVPDALHAVPRSVFASSAHALDKYYDQIAWFGRSEPLVPRSAGSFDFMPHVYGSHAMTRLALSHRVSDHYPLWVEL